MKSEIEIKDTVIFRDSGIELLRSVLMFFIVIHHLIVHGSHLVQVTELPVNIATYQKLFYEAFVLFPVDCFVLISGYYSINLKLKKAFSLWFQCFSYSLGIAILFSLFTHEAGVKLILKSFFPITFSTWWFISCYFFLMLLSPALNTLAITIKKNMFEYLLIIGAIMNCCISFITNNTTLGGSGSTLVNFIFIYFIGRYICIHKYSFSRSNSLFFYLISCIAIASISFFLLNSFSGKGIWRLYQFNNPFIIFEAVCVFYFFKTVNFKSKYVNLIGSMSLSVYLIHDNGLVREWIYSSILRIEIFSNKLTYILFLILFASIIFFISILIEISRKIISHKIIALIYGNRIFKVVETKLDSLQEKNIKNLTIQ